MSLRTTTAATLTLLGLACAQAFAQSAAPAEAAPAAAKANFEVLDSNRDGFVSKDEAAGMKGLTEAFDKVDANKDGKLDSKEFAAAAGR